MRPNKYTISAVLLLILCQFNLPVSGQLGFNLDIKKPKEYDDRVLRSEKSDQKKFNLPRRFVQNTVTHYNYFFNANNKLNEVLERAKTSFTDDYSKLLPFYNYTLDVTAQDSLQLDSIVQKSTSGIALHDLRNDWVDNLYLLWGAAYYFRKEFDTAYLMFQYINYAFAPKEKDGYYVTIGSSRDGNSAYSISTKEKNSLPRKVFSEPPSRNEAFIWQIRNFLAQDQFAEAASLIVTLKNDPVFPHRLQKDLDEVQAFWFYKQSMWDSAATHLVKALDNATNKQEKARWEYLAAQLFELSGQNKEAEKYYARVISHTTDPVMDIYARLYSIRVHKDGSDNYIDKNIAELIKMAKRDKFEEYRDIIYYMAAQMQLERNNFDGAVALLQKGAEHSSGNISHRNKIFLQLAELAYKQRNYRQAYNFYDSLQLSDPMLEDPDAITIRKEMLGRLALNAEIIERQDSLQRIVAMGEDERREFVKRVVRDIRRQQGLKDESIPRGGTLPLTQQPPTNLFGNNDSKGEWYFYNAAYRVKGAADFKSRWGNRSNTDNWRRSASATNQVVTNPNNPLPGQNKILTSPDGGVTFDILYDKLPLTPELLKASNDSIQAALFTLGKIYIQEVEDCSSGSQTMEDLRNRFPGFEKMDEVLFNLYYCYNKNGETGKAAAIKKLLTDKYPASNFTAIVTTGKDPQAKTVNNDATRAYEKVYDLFVEGNFDEAVTQKKIADSLYGRNYWTPQLGYIEAVYYIKQRDDSTAKKVLSNVINQFPGTPLAVKSANLMRVLEKRQQIENELRNLNVTRYDDPNKVIVNNPPPVVKKDTVVTKPPVQPPPVNNPVRPVPDTTTKKPQIITSPYTYVPTDAQYVVLILNKVDPVFVNEAKNAFFRYNRETFYNKQMSVEIVDIDADNRLLVISPFTNSQDAVSYVDQTKPKTASEIIPWLKGGKYSFSIISDKNLALLKANKDVENYKLFLNQHLPGKF
jgi:tetratricopeptide (TPR) repeat protein